MAFGVLAGQITVIFLEVLLGYVGARSGIIKDRDSKFLSDFIMKLLLPCTMLAGAAVDGEPELLTQAGVLFVLLLWRGITIAAHAPDRFGALLVVGFTVQVALQAVLNVAVVTNTIPNTGISLPFFSSGGTSLMMLLGEMGIVLSVSRGET